MQVDDALTARSKRYWKIRRKKLIRSAFARETIKERRKEGNEIAERSLHRFCNRARPGAVGLNNYHI